MRKKLTYAILSALIVSAFASSMLLNIAAAEPVDQPLTVSVFSDITVLPGWTWYFVGYASGGAGGYSYQWYEGTTPIAGQTDMILAVSKDVPGIYLFYLVAVDAAGNRAISTADTLTVIELPTFEYFE